MLPLEQPFFSENSLKIQVKWHFLFVLAITYKLMHIFQLCSEQRFPPFCIETKRDHKICSHIREYFFFLVKKYHKRSQVT